MNKQLGSISLNKSETQSNIVEFYEGLFSEQLALEAQLDDPAFDSTWEEEAWWLKYVLKVVYALNGEKARDLDGFLRISVKYVQID